MACSRSHHSGPVLQIINALKAEGHELAYIKKGSALKFFDLASGRADIYPRFAPTMEWDIAAGQAILEALGGEVVHAETGEPLTQVQFSEALTALSEATPDQVTEIVDTILASEVTSEQAEQLVAAVEVLSAITGEQAQELFQAIEPAQLSESMAAVISDAMNDPAVPDEVKEAFEGTLNIFGNDGFSTYVPLGSNVNVAVRRTIIAGTTILVALPSPAPARRT
jgi:hypothetical protein